MSGNEKLKMIYPEFQIETYLHHMNRYRFADNILPQGIQVFDYACGTGYGTNLLANNNRFVVGFDKNKESIEYARDHRVDNTSFVEKDIVDMNITYTDAVVVFELIEHLSKKDGRFVLEKINKFADYIVLSTPKDAKIGINKFHRSQWSINELKKCLDNFDVSVFGQDWQSGQVVFPFSEQTSMYIMFGYKK